MVTVPSPDVPALAFRSTDAVTLTTERSTATVEAEAVARGAAGNIGFGRELRLDPDWARHNLNLGAAVIKSVAGGTSWAASSASPTPSTGPGCSASPAPCGPRRRCSPGSST